MIEELHRRNFAATTIRTYLHGVEHFSRYFRSQARSACLAHADYLRRKISY